MGLILYTRAGCHLCEVLKAELEPLARDLGLTVREVDIDTDAALATRYGEQVPVVQFDGHTLAKGRLEPDAFRRRLERLRQEANSR